MSAANLLTMILGMPATWFATAIATGLTVGGGAGDGSVAYVLRNPAWLGPAMRHETYWAVPLGLIIMCVPFYFMSWLVEYAVIKAFDKPKDKARAAQIWTCTRRANFVTYVLLVLLLIGSMYFSL